MLLFPSMQTIKLFQRRAPIVVSLDVFTLVILEIDVSKESLDKG